MFEDDISDDVRKVLEFEREWWKYAGEKPQAIKSEFGISEKEYYRQLSFIVASAEAYRYDPVLIKRLRRIAVQRERQKNNL